ncbi:MAG: HlyD family efflux transporter periplasmic adaptor subunit [Candidatus Acidiferrales bacterium]
MRYGPTSLQISSVLAKGLHRPKLREDLKISAQQVAGKASFVIKDPDTASYNRYGPTEYELLTLCDGTRTAAEVAEEMNARHPDSSLDETSVLDFLDTVESNLWVRTVGEKNLAMLERIRDERKGRTESSLLYIQFKAWNPDKTLAWLDPYLGWIYTRGFIIFCIAAFIAAMAILAGDWYRIQQDSAALYSFSNKSAYDLWAFWIIMLAVGGIHEFAHGLTCKHYGGEVPQMGFILIYFTPAFYTDTTDILIFDTTMPRQLTIFAGIWVELLLCALATLVWAFTLPGSLVNDLAYKTLLFTGIAGIAVNLNPLIKADGYYALAQFVQIDSLREDSIEFAQAWWQKYLLRRKVELPAASRRQRRIFLAFGTTAMVYGVAVLVIALIFVNNIFVSVLGDWGYFATALALFLLLRSRVQQQIPRIRAWYWSIREAYLKWKLTRAQQVFVAVVALVLFVPPFSSKVSSEFILEPGQNAEIRSPVGGQLANILVRSGQEVRAGDVLAELKNPELDSRAASLASQLGNIEGALRIAEQHTSRGEAARAEDERARLSSELSLVRSHIAGLALRSPIHGIVVEGDIEPHEGDFLNQGDEFVRVVDRSEMRARILVHDWEVGEVAVGAPVKLKVSDQPFRTSAGRVERILPAAAADRPISQPNKVERRGQEVMNYFAVEMVFPNTDGSLIEGMTGTAKISGKHRPFAWQAAAGVWRWVHSQIW